MSTDLSTLTESSIEFLWEIYKYKRDKWANPTYRQLARLKGVRSVAYVHRCVTRLKAKGLLHDTEGPLEFDRDRVEEFLRDYGYDLSGE